MKKLTAGIFATLLAVVSADGAYAAIASSGYVDEKVGEVSQTVTTLSDTVRGHTTQIAGKANTADLGDLATLDAVGSAQITDGAVATTDIASKAVTKEKLADDIVTSLGKADSALQQASLNGYLTKTAADAAYAGKTLETQVGTVSKENMGTTTATTVVAGVKEAIDAAKAADTKAGSAASAASAAQSAAGTAQAAAEAAQGDVDALEVRVGTAETDIDGIQGQLENMATSETVEGLQTTVTNLQSTKQDKTDNTLTTGSKTVVGAINEVKAQADKGVSDAATAKSAADAAKDAADAAQRTADAKQDKLTGTIGGSMQPVYLNDGTITAGTALGTLATKSKVTNSEVDDGALAQSKINGLAASLATKLTTPPTSSKGESGLYVLTYDGTDFEWEDIARTVAE